MFKRAVRGLLLGIWWPFRPLMRLFCWWTPLSVGPLRNAALLPDSMAIFLSIGGGVWVLPYFGWVYASVYCVAVLLSPVALLNLVLVRESEVFVFRLVAFVPYWRHRIPADAKFDLYEAWEDPAPTGVAFEAKSYGADPLHLGTSRSAEALFSYLGGLLENAGWKRGVLGYKHPSGDTDAL